MYTLNYSMQDGKIQLPSGVWDWRLRPQQSGATVTFRHRDRQQDEMRTWSQDLELSSDRVRELALEPVERLWLDPDGLLWSIQVELPSDWARASEEKAGGLRLVFSCGSLRKKAMVPRDTKLGELSHFELTRLLNSA